jgi:beta-lactamase regulating signal transducer with metallopeptidase domain
MSHLFQLPILQALGYAITNSLWQMALLWLAYLLISMPMKGSARKRYNLAVIFQVLGFVWFLFTFNFYHQQYTGIRALQDAMTTNQSTVTTIVPHGTGFKSWIIKSMIWAEQLLPYLSVAYLLLLIVLLIRWYLGYKKINLLRTQGLVEMPGEWVQLFTRLTERMQIGRKIGFFLSEKVASPLTIGFLKPMVLVPVASINHLTMAQLEAIILHELAHIKRLDYLVNLFLSITEIGLFFNPFTQLLARQIRKEREHCCDDWVLAYQYNPATYAEALLRLAQLQPAPAYAMAATGNGQHELLGRIKRMVGAQEKTFNYRKQLLSFLMVTGILSCIAWFSPAKTPETAQQPSVNDTSVVAIQPISVEPMAVKVTNPLFNPAFFLSGTLKEEMQENLKLAALEVQNSLNSAEVRETFEKLPETVNMALKQASEELRSNNIMQSEKMRSDMLQAYSIFDSLKLTAPLLGTKRMMDETNKAIQLGLTAAGTAIEQLGNIPTLIPELENLGIDKNINIALDELNKIGLQKLIPASEWDKIMKDVNEAIKTRRDSGKEKKEKQDQKKKNQINLPSLQEDTQERDSILDLIVIEQIREEKRTRLTKEWAPLFHRASFQYQPQPFAYYIIMKQLLFEWYINNYMLSWPISDNEPVDHDQNM